MQREAGMAAAIIEFDALANAVGTAAQNDDLLLIRRASLIALVSGNACLIGRIHIGRGGGEFGGAGVDALEDRPDVELVAMRAYPALTGADQFGEPLVGKAHGLEAAQIDVIFGQALLANLLFHLHDAFDLADEPRIILAGGVYIIDGGAQPQSLRHFQNAVGAGSGERRADGILVIALIDAVDPDLVQSGQTGFKSAQSLLQRFLEGAANGHHFAH